ncbi:XdhC family protein [Cupriavidus sp. WS]|uniref:XdhC family protein n=1 Tax=Cupriavidus sp. WS TaxID=1312922 RepID=UPI00036375D4|nr:XdhC family protein [Cupriavidus sp. WS]
MNHATIDPATDPATDAIDGEALLLREQRLIDALRPFAVITVIRAQPPTSAWVGAQALLEEDGALHGWVGGGCSRAIVIQAALEAIRTGAPKLLRISNAPAAAEAGIEMHAMPCASNGTLELFIQPTLPPPVALVLGATPTALEACVLAQRMGFAVVAAAGMTVPLAALGLRQVVAGYDPAALAALAPRLVLVATQGDGDEDALEAALRGPAAAVLLVASQRKAQTLREAMQRRGIAPQRLAALHAPAGPHIHARTPQEIALGAVAGLVALRRQMEEEQAAQAPAQSGEALPAMLPCESMAPAPAATAARYVNPVCGMAVDIASARHVVEHGGQRVYFCCDGCKVEFERDPDKYLPAARGARKAT